MVVVGGGGGGGGYCLSYQPGGVELFQNHMEFQNFCIINYGLRYLAALGKPYRAPGTKTYIAHMRVMEYTCKKSISC